MNEFPCGVCNDGLLKKNVVMKEFTYRERTGRVIIQSLECNNCKCSTTTNRQSKENKAAVIAFKRGVDAKLDQ
jgi:hypothetical protein